MYTPDRLNGRNLLISAATDLRFRVTIIRQLFNSIAVNFIAGLVITFFLADEYEWSVSIYHVTDDQ